MLTAPVQAGPTSITRWGGLAGLVFAVSAAVQNLWAGAAGIAPDNDADAREIVTSFAEHAGAHGVVSAWVAANVVLLAIFVAAAHTRMRAAEPAWSMVGVVGGVLLMALFVLVNVPLVALALGAESWGSETALVDALWDMHLATFAYAGVALGIALLGFSLAAAAHRLVPSWFRAVGPVGALVIIAFSIPVQDGADGAAYTMTGGIGFLAWLLFLVVFGLRLWRER